MALTLDEISNGRLILGLGTGWNRAEFDAFGLPFAAKVDRFEEALQIIIPLLREGQVSFEGTYYRAVDCEMVPRGPRLAGPPVLIAAHQPRMLSLAARYADSWNTASVWFGSASGFAAHRDALEAACVEVQRDPSTLEVTVYLEVSVAESAPDHALVGSPEQMAGVLHSYAEVGVRHVICLLNPPTPEALEHLTQALSLYHAMKQ